MKPRSDADREAEIGIVRKDRTAVQVGRVYSRGEIEALEEKLVPWLRRRRRWVEQRQRSS